MKVRLTLSLGAAGMLAACVPQPQATQPPQPSPAPAPAPPSPPPPVAAWQDAPLTPGGWSYLPEADGGSNARFGPAGAEPLFIIRCDRSRQIALSTKGTAAGPMTIRTSFGARNLQASSQATASGYVAARLPATDPLLDSIAFSRGRFSVEAPGAGMLIIPAWPEAARVIEDCRR